MQYHTQELSPQTWPDFEQLFSGGHGWDHCWCMAFQRVPRDSKKPLRTRAETSARNHQIKHALVNQGRAHGILVYADHEPIGWCQYGSSDELVATRGTPTVPGLGEDRQRLWRVPCFVVDRSHRRRGVAGLALQAALESIQRRGGGLVEAYPVTHWTHGAAGAAHSVRYVQGVGPVAPAWGGFNNVSTSGIVSMFEKRGFEAVAVCASASSRVRSMGALGCNVLMRRMVASSS